MATLYGHCFLISQTRLCPQTQQWKYAARTKKLVLLHTQNGKKKEKKKKKRRRRRIRKEKQQFLLGLRLVIAQTNIDLGMLVYIRDGSAQTNVRAATLR